MWLAMFYKTNSARKPTMMVAPVMVATDGNDDDSTSDDSTSDGSY